MKYFTMDKDNLQKNVDEFRFTLVIEVLSVVQLLTGNVQRGVSAPCDTVLVGGDAPVDAGILLLLVLHRAQEEEGSIRQKDPVGLRILRSGLNRKTILEPFNFGGFWSSTIESDRFVPDYRTIDRMLCYFRYHRTWNKKMEQWLKNSLHYHESDPKLYYDQEYRNHWSRMSLYTIL